MNGSRILVSTRKGLFTLTRDAHGAWNVGAPQFLGTPVSLTLRDPADGALYAALNHGHFGVKVHRSSDEGVTWEERATPAFPKDDEGATLKLVWALESAGGTLWAGTIPGGLFRSTDGAASWELVRPLWDRPERKEWFGGGYDKPGIHSICIDPRDSRALTVGISCGGVWITRDGGASWTLNATGMRAAFMPPEKRFDPNIQDPHRVVQCAARPEVLWAQHHNGLFRTTDGATSWTEITNVSPSTFGFAAAVHPRDPDTAWFVPAVLDECRVPVDGKVVVNRTRDGGRTFETLHRGLPGTHAYDLVYRHGLDLDPSGERLVMGSTSGGLWISEDQGDSWLTPAARLPPIYAVRFA